MKIFNFLKFALLLNIICFSACSGDASIDADVESEGIKIDSELAINGLYFLTEKGEKTITFSTNDNWTLSIEDVSRSVSWCKPSAVSGGKGTATVTFAVEENLSFDIRTVSVKIKSGINSKSFKISQKGAMKIPGNLIPGIQFREIISRLANGMEKPGNTIEISEVVPDTIIERIVVKLNESTPPHGNYVIISSDDSLRPVYAIWDNKGQITIQTKANVLYMSNNASYMFYALKKLAYCDLTKMNSLNVKYMQGLFKESGISSLDLSGFNTSIVVNMQEMFSGCRNLTTLDVSGFETSNVRDMSMMFLNCEKLTALDISKFNTSNVDKMISMFNGCKNLTTLDVSSFNTSNVTRMDQMFGECESLTTLNVSNFNTSKVTKMDGMFGGCKNLTILNVDNFDTSNVMEMAGMFHSCESLTSLDLSGFNTSNVKNTSWMFNGCENLTTLNVSSFNTSKVEEMISMFSICIKLETLDLSNFNTSKVKDMSYMFYSCELLKSLDITSFSFIKNPNVLYMLDNIGNNHNPVSIIVTEAGYNYLTKTTDNCCMNTSVKFVKLDGTVW